MKEFRKDQDGRFICEECGKIIKDLTALSKHVSSKHMSKENYFTKWIFEEKDNICKAYNCINTTKFIGFCGYKNTCCKKCGNNI